MAPKDKVPRCSECGVELKLHSDRCPLCGHDVAGSMARHPAGKLDDETYRSNVRDLRDELRRLRSEEDAEAV